MKLDISQAVAYVRCQGSPIEMARLRYLENPQPPTVEVLAEFEASQRPDGSWAPFWAPDYSSLDATCFRLAQAAQLGMAPDSSYRCILLAQHFLVSHQGPDGTWEEDPLAAQHAPPWARPGELAARLYLTSNCAFWLARRTEFFSPAIQGATSLYPYLDVEGQLPSFFQTHWLAAGLFFSLHWINLAERLARVLAARLAQYSASDLTWMITALRTAGLPADHPLIQGGAARLAGFRTEEGRWASDDGAGFEVHTTLEALYALQLAGWLA